MNISQPIASSIEAVEFSNLSPQDTLRLSAKRIVNPITFDNLLQPIPGGLYDTHLGAFLDLPCSTCRLNLSFCPGHCGHIELPVEVFNCVFLDQMYRLLRAHCVHCHRFRLSRVEINRVCCKLRLIREGLLEEAEALEYVQLKKQGKTQVNQEDEGDLSEDSEGDAGDLISQRNLFVEKHLRKLRRARKHGQDAAGDSEAVTDARKAVVREFQASIVKTRKCANCQITSPRYRKNKATSIFRIPLSNKDQAANAQRGAKSVENPLEKLNQWRKQQEQKRQERKQQMRESYPELVDEAVADLSDSSMDIEPVRVLDAPSPSRNEEDDESEEIEREDRETSNPLVTEASTFKAKKNSKDEPGQVFMNPNEVHAALTFLFEREREVLGLVYGPRGNGRAEPPSVNMFFLKSLLVPPNKWRKEQKTGPDLINEHPSNECYRKILNISNDLIQLRHELCSEAKGTYGRQRNFDDLQNLWLGLQDSVNSLIDSDKNPIRGIAALRNPEGIKQKLEKKEGLFRMNIMGKRVNFAARSVISPDPNIETNEIGVPPVFARKLTYPEPVTSHNFDELKQAVLNGPDKWPGASAVEYENGQVMVLRKKNVEERQALANLLMAPSNASMNGARTKRVHRHLNNGDVVLMNRQPTLHKPSIMAHKARVLSGEKTIRMHYANCKTYNADFDGDEMNMHFPQNEIARAEALEIADTDHQYLSATAGEPLRGLIQDHISMGVWLTCKDSFFTREEYQELLYSSIKPERNDIDRERIFMIEPAMLKPVRRWTGKQVISTILSNLQPEGYAGFHFMGESSTPSARWDDGSDEGTVRVFQGHMLTGVLDKNQIGPSTKGLVHLVYESWGPTLAGKLLSILGRLLTRFLHMRALSCGVEDLILTDDIEKARLQQLQQANAIGLGVASKYVSMEKEQPENDDQELMSRLEAVIREDEKQAALEQLTNSQTQKVKSAVDKACLPNGLQKDFPQNQMQLMTGSGAKGSGVNASQISCSLGQQVLEGRRVPIMVSGKTLPSFKAYETHVRAGGFIMDRFLTGIRPQEYYFHAMAGREGLIDTAVKTSSSGYLQRCVLKGMEGLRAEHDASVRDSDGTLIQALYGEDGLDITKQRNIGNFHFIARNFESIARSGRIHEIGGMTRNPEARKYNKKADKVCRRTENVDAMDPVMALYSPARHAGSNSEIYMRACREYTEKNPEKLLHDGAGPGTIKKRHFEELIDFNYLRSVVEPGEAVGAVAAQSIGEPSTQMTLNTFHLAGHAAKNVTLGIPRLREILMTASVNIKTPTMSLYLIPEMSEDDGKKFAAGLSKYSIADVIDEVRVEERRGVGSMDTDARVYDVRLSLFPADEYLDSYGATIMDVARTIEQKFVPMLDKSIERDMKKKTKDKSLQTASDSDALPTIGEASGRVQDYTARENAENEGGESDQEIGGDDDATTTKRRTNLDEGLTYEDPDDDEQDIVRQAQRQASPDTDQEDEGYSGSAQGSDGHGSDSEGDEEIQKKTSAQNREARIKDRFAHITSFSLDDKAGSNVKINFEYPATSPKLLLLPIIQQAAHASIIQEIPGISSATVTKDSDAPDAESYVLTAGSNLLAMRNFQHIINPHRLRTNDIGAMLRLYGVEAARNAIIAELHHVFSSHSIKVDIRHLTLVADYMTRGGGYLPFSRNGMRDKTSAFAKMSFETTMGFLRDAVYERDVEDLKSPSARITVGKHGRMGTGAFDVLVPLC